MLDIQGAKRPGNKMSTALSFLFRKHAPGTSKHGTSGEECTRACHVCGATPTLYIVYRKGYCKAHKVDADIAGIRNAHNFRTKGRSLCT